MISSDKAPTHASATSFVNNRYRITRRIGGGSFGEIYLGIGPNEEKVGLPTFFYLLKSSFLLLFDPFLSVVGYTVTFADYVTRWLSNMNDMARGVLNSVMSTKSIVNLSTASGFVTFITSAYRTTLT